MGNCLRNNKVSSQDHDGNYDTPIVGSKVEKVKVFALSKLEAPRLEEQSMMNKKVRFKMQDDDDHCEGERRSDSNARRVRIRVVMTQDELKKMLKCNDEAQHHTTLEQLIDAVKLRGGRISEVGVCNQRLNSWRPTLHSIPEDRFINLG